MGARSRQRWLVESPVLCAASADAATTHLRECVYMPLDTYMPQFITRFKCFGPERLLLVAPAQKRWYGIHADRQAYVRVSSYSCELISSTSSPLDNNHPTATSQVPAGGFVCKPRTVSIKPSTCARGRAAGSPVARGLLSARNYSLTLSTCG